MLNRIISLRVFFTFLFLLSSFCFSYSLFAGGFETYIISTRGKVLGGAITGTADDPSAVFYNPAGLATLKPGPVHWEVSAAATYINYTFKDKHDNNKKYESDMLPVLPSVFLSKTFSNNFALGFGMYIPWGGGGVDYGKTSPTQPIKDGYLALVAFTPAISYKISPRLFVGAALSGYYGKVEQTLVPGPTIKEKYSGYAGYNAHFGVLLKPTDQYNIGLFVRTPTKISLDGKSKIVGVYKQDATLEFTLPTKISIGLSYKKTESLLFATNLSYLFYDTFDEMKTRYQTTGQVLKNKTGFKNHMDAGVGFEYSGLDKYTFRGSVRYSPSGTSKGHINAFNNDIDYMLFDAGIGYKITKNLEIVFNLGYNCGISATNDNGKYDAYQIVTRFGLRTTY